MNFADLSKEEMLAIRAARPFTAEEKAVLFGDADRTPQRIQDGYYAALVARYVSGQYLTKADKKTARRLLKPA